MEYRTASSGSGWRKRVTNTKVSVPGAAGYAEQADGLIESYESVNFDELYRPLLELLPKGGRALDIGAGTGRDAAALARLGFQVRR